MKNENEEFELKDLRLGKIIFHVIIGKLKISDIKDVRKVYEILYGLDKFTMRDLKNISYKNLLMAIEFRNNYTRLRKIDKAFVLEFIINKLKQINEKEEVKEIIKILFTKFDIPASISIILEKLKEKNG